MKGSPTKINLKGKKINKLKVIDFVGKRKSRWKCLCDCGNKIEVYTSYLINNHTTSCGCMDGKGMLQHGLSKTRFYRIYDSLKRRCRDKSNCNYHRYGGREIKCKWKTALDFKNDMYESYLIHCDKFGIKDTTIERIDNDGNYCKENCRWATLKEQNRNKSDNVWIKYKGEKMIVSDYAKKIGVHKSTIFNRIYRGWSSEEIIKEKIHHEFNSYKNGRTR